MITDDERTIAQLWATSSPAGRRAYWREKGQGRAVYDPCPPARDPRDWVGHCPRCGDAFVSDPAGKKVYCSNSCRSLAWYHRNAVSRRAISLAYYYRVTRPRRYPALAPKAA